MGDILSVCDCLILSDFFQFQRELSAAGLDHFEKGNLESFNPDVALHDQAYLLPYNRRYEFPKEQLKLGEKPLNKMSISDIENDGCAAQESNWGPVRLV